MNINIENRLVVISGPTTSGKTTLANRIKSEFSGNCKVISHDDIARRLPRNISSKEQKYLFISQLLEELSSSILDESIDLVVLESILCIIDDQTMFFLEYLQNMSCCKRITLIKMALPIELQLEFCKKRKELENECPTTDILVKQNAMFYSPYGTFNKRYPNCDEFIVKDPRRLTLDIRPNGSKKF